MAKTRRICHLLLRSVAFAATLCAVIVMASSHERGSIFSLSFEAKYTAFPFFEYFFIVNSVATVYGFLVLFIPAESLLWQPVVAVDLTNSYKNVINGLILWVGFDDVPHLKLLCIAAYAIGLVGKKGNIYLKPICGSIPKYCDQVRGAFIVDFIAVIIYIVLLLHSIHTAVNPHLLKKRLTNFSGSAC
ncbi:CASP-like protein 1C1, partial [Mucuna pruriens]